MHSNDKRKKYTPMMKEKKCTPMIKEKKCTPMIKESTLITRIHINDECIV